LKIILNDDGNFYLTDYGSKHGTFVNEIKAIGVVPLNRDDVIRIGNTVLPWKNYFSKSKTRTVTKIHATEQQTNNSRINVFAAICSCILIIAFFLPWIRISVLFLQISGYEIPLKMNTVLSGKEDTILTVITFASYLFYLIPVFAVINFLSYLKIFNSRCKYTEFVIVLSGCIGLVILILVDIKIPFEDLFKILAPGFYISFGVSILGLITSVSYGSRNETFANVKTGRDTRLNKNDVISEGTDSRYIVINVNQPQQQSNGVGIAGFVLALIAVFIGWIPVLNVLCWLLGLILSFAGLFKKPRGLAIVGFIISIILLPLIVLLGLFGFGLLFV
jgi:hypothetical protein